MNKQITVEFNAGNLIPHYQQKYRLYDRFLPHLAPYLDGTVIDVGANCGVLAVSMGMNNSKLSFICVEPEDQCLELLYKNTEKIDNHVEVIAGRVGTEDIKLDEIVKEGVGLIKVDVDGYDWDVINTFSFSTKPPIYIEEDGKEEWQYSKYFDLNQKFKEQGYNNIWMFDNFGCLIGFTNNWTEVDTLNAYINRMKKGKSEQTLWYLDLLICQDADVERLGGAVLAYLEK